MSDDAPAPEPTEEPAAPLEPATPEQIEKAEQLIRQSRLATMRKQPEVARKLMEEAIEAAPNAIGVLEAIGDDFSERMQHRKAMETYKKALDIDPTNINIERKYAESVLATQGMKDPMAMLQGGPDVGLYASGNVAVILNLFIPGLGQYILGQKGPGIAYFLCVVVGWVLAILVPDGLSGLGRMMGSRGGETNMLVLLPLMFAVGAHLTSLFTAAAFAKRYQPRRVERPMPLVDKDYEI